MSSLNRVILIGRVATPPELRYTTTGKAVASFRMAVDRRGRSGGESNADFIPVVAWERLAEICNEFLTKGKLIAIEGRLQTRTYETPEGQKRSAFDVVADDMRMLGSRSEGEGGGGGGQYNRPPRGNEGYRSPREGGPPTTSAPEPRQTGPSHDFGDDFEAGLGVDDEVPF
jgi:single-strand DNA-binding protein